MMQKKLGSTEQLLDGGVPMSSTPSDEGFGGSEEYDAEDSGIGASQPHSSPGQYLSFSLDDQDEMKSYENFSVDDFTH